MKYNKLGRSGLKVSEVSFGSWLTFGPKLDLAEVKLCLHKAFDLGINFFDNAEVYAEGQSEILMGKVLKDFRREDLVVSTKIFWGGKGPNDEGLSFKHLVEGTKGALKRLALEYVDLLFCHRPDLDTPVDETVRAMDYLIKSGFAFYWGTSEWPAERIEQAFSVAEKFNCIPPTMEQPQYNMLVRDRVEKEYSKLFEKYGLGTTIWSPLASGILTGKYAAGIPKGSRLDEHDWLRRELSEANLEKIRKLSEIAKEIGCSMTQFALAWCLKNPNVSTVILGATNMQQLEENVAATRFVDKISSDILMAVDSILK